MVKVVRDAGGPIEAIEAVNSALASPAGGRLTLVSQTPVMIADVSGATTIFYTPYVNDLIAIFIGSWTMRKFPELANITTNSVVGRAGPAVVVANSMYDLFVWDDAGTLRLTRGPLWTSDTTRGVGAGTTELVRVDGVWLNARTITNGPAAQRGTYVGTVRSDAGAAIDWELGGYGVAGGDPGFLYVWNAYNRVDVAVETADSTNSWTYAVVGVWRSANASNAMRVSWIQGLAEEAVYAEYLGMASEGFGSVPYSGIGFDSTTVKCGFTGIMFIGGAGTGIHQAQGRYKEVALGFHFFQAIELNNGFGVATFWGDAGIPLILQSGLVVWGKF
jgi:hypothetical protein